MLPAVMKKTKSPHNFGGLPGSFSDYGNSEIVIMPVPFDKTSTWIRGSEKGPEAIISASENMELYDIETDTEVYRKGIHTLREVTASATTGMIRKSYAMTKRLLRDDKFVVTLGGEHTVSLGPIRAHLEIYGDISILHLDAHSDMRRSYEGRKYSHACVMARVREITDATVSVGVRSMDSSEISDIDRNRVFYASDLQGRSDWARRVVSILSRNVYVTIDLDVLDPSVMPSTGTPEPGGMDWYQLIRLLEMVANKRRVVGFDVVELCPSANKAPDFLAAKLAYKFLSLIFS
jgi:agmatinase